ncbi:MAG: response regulator [Bdellovibrionales bacterium]|nr:response regulator [Bdellovibrionales bacterium]
MIYSHEVPHILLIRRDDDSDPGFSESFKAAGWDCTTVSDLKSALAHTESQSVDVILTDYIIAGMKGTDVVRTLKDSNPNQAVVMVTASASVDDAVEIIKAGALDLISLPIEFGRLEQRIARSLSLLKKQEWQRQLFQHVGVQKSSYQFVTRDIVNEPLPLLIVEQLKAAGVLCEAEKVRMSLVLHEVLANSIEHGNLELRSEWRDDFDDEGIDKYTLKKHERLADPTYAERLLWIETQYTGDTLTIAVQDQGPGFDFEKVVAEAMKLEKAAGLSGRGNFLISQGVDSFTYSDGGRRIELLKKLRD